MVRCRPLIRSPVRVGGSPDLPVVATRKQHNNNTKSKNKIHNTIRPHPVSRKHYKSLGAAWPPDRTTPPSSSGGPSVWEGGYEAPHRLRKCVQAYGGMSGATAQASVQGRMVVKKRARVSTLSLRQNVCVEYSSVSGETFAHNTCLHHHAPYIRTTNCVFHALLPQILSQANSDRVRADQDPSAPNATLHPHTRILSLPPLPPLRRMPL